MQFTAPRKQRRSDPRYVDMINSILPSSITVGRGSLTTLPTLLNPKDRVLLVTTRHHGMDGSVLGPVEDANVLTWSGEPEIDVIEQQARLYRDSAPDVVVAIGGGSVLDTGKLLAAALPNSEHPLLDYIEVVGAGRTFDNPPLRVIAAPTTAGTGAEMTKNAVVTISAANQKASLRDPRLVPDAVIIDPVLSEGLPASVAKACALDAAVQLVESYATPFANTFSDLWSLGGAETGLRTAERVIDGHFDLGTRTEMAVAAMCSGAALANSKLGAIHGFAAVVGGTTGMGHGELCGLFAGPVLRRTIERLQAEQPDSSAIDRYRRLAILAGWRQSNTVGLADWFDELAERADLKCEPIANLSTEEQSKIVYATHLASSTAGNPFPLNHDDLREILEEVASQ